jgi:hypothetical protein
VAENNATGDTENTDAPQTTTPVVETPQDVPVAPKARKTRARKATAETTAEPVESSEEQPAVTDETPSTVSENTEEQTPEPVLETTAAEPSESSTTETPAVEVPTAEEASVSETPPSETPAAEPEIAAPTVDPEPVAEEKPKKKRASTRKAPAKPTAADRKSTRKKAASAPEVPAENEAPATDTTTTEVAATAEVSAASDNAESPENTDVSAPSDDAVVELTEATKRRRKSTTAKKTTKKAAAKKSDETSEDEKSEDTTNEAETEDKPASKRRTAASAKTAPRTRKTIKPADEEIANNETEAEAGAAAEPAEEKPKRRATKATAKKTTPKPRTRKPKTEEPTAVAVPDPAAPTVDDEPLVMDAKDAIAEAPVLSEKTKRARKPRVTPEDEASETTAAAEVIAAAEATVAAAGTDSALGSDRTVIAPPSPQPTIIERVPPQSSKRITLTVIFVAIGLVGLGIGWIIGSAANEDSGSSETPITVPGDNDTTTPTTAGSAINPNAPGQAGNGQDLFTLSGSNPRQSALFTLPAEPVTLHYDSTGGTFNAKLLPQSGGDGTSFECSSACDKEQPIQAPPGSYYFDIQSSGGDWNIRVTK